MPSDEQRFWLRCNTTEGAIRLADGVEKLRSAIAAYLKQPPGHNTPSPWVLEQWRNRVEESKISMLRFPAPLELVLESFAETFGSARIVRLEPLTGVQRQYGVTVVTSDAGMKEHFERLQQIHRELISFVSALRKRIRSGPCEVVSVEAAEIGLKIRRDGKLIETTMAQDRTLATLMLLGIEDWIQVTQFCKTYSGFDVPDADSYFDTQGRQLKEDLPTFGWDPNGGGGRKISGILVETSLTTEELKAFVEGNRDKRKPARKKPKKKAASKPKKERKLAGGKTGSSGKPGK